MAKEKQIARTVGIRAADADNPNFNRTSFSFGPPKNRPQQNQKEEQDRKDIEERIGELFPDRYAQNITIEALKPAPDEWNFFPKPDRYTMMSLMQSIIDYGLLHPIIVWEQTDHSYMILGGHSRYQAFLNLRQTFPEHADRFNAMRCTVYGHDKLDESTARQIIIMDNTTQRQKESQETMISVVVEMHKLKLKERDGKRAKRDEENRKRINEVIGDALGVSKGTVFNILKFENLLPEYLPLLNKKEISKGLARNIAQLSQELQHMILDAGWYKYPGLKQLPVKFFFKDQTRDGLQSAMSLPTEHTITARCKLSHDLPKDYQTFLVAAAPNEMTVVKEVVLNALKNMNGLSKETRELAYELLKP